MLQLEELPVKDFKKPLGYGTIYQSSKSCYKVVRSRKYYCSCRTLEQAYYVRRELNKCNWDKSKLPQILDDYSIFYTDLLEFYRYITRNKGNGFLKWIVTIPSKKSDNGITQNIRYSKLEDALFERDFLFEHNWDYELLVEQIDDRKNPYYNYQLPPYPQRKIRNIRVKDNHHKELTQVIQMLKEDPRKSQEKICEVIGVTDMTLRNWLSDYNTTWSGFKDLILDGVNPLDVLKFNRHIYTPDLSVHRCRGKDYVYYCKSRKTNPYRIERCRVVYGYYPNKSVARKIVNELKKCDWDKSKLPNIQRKCGFVPK